MENSQTTIELKTEPPKPDNNDTTNPPDDDNQNNKDSKPLVTQTKLLQTFTLCANIWMLG